MFNSLLLIALSAVAAEPLKPGDHSRTVTVGKLERTYLVHVPPKYDGAKAMPVVLVFHGGGSNPEQMEKYCGLDAKADEAGFIAVYPAGSGHLSFLTWNAGNCCGYAERNNVDDVAFVRALLDDLIAADRIDEKRIYATGMSNGGIFCYRLADEMSDRIAAIAPVSGTMGSATCQPKRPVPIIHFHGTADEFVAFGGGGGPKSISKTDFFSVDHTMKQWTKADGCPTDAGGHEAPRQGSRRHDCHAQDFWPRPRGSGNRALRDRRRRAHLARPHAANRLPRQVDDEHLGQRFDVEFFYEASAEVRRPRPRSPLARG